ncbi:DUF962 domain-containing protein [Aliikangiella marina]|uniref:DUF962 domain-containing protein n=1 Tax=Aliikangiella marina TaxID=1712262 RepID=A0A545T8W5_9GAMM|nr:DUF962 domain-containing protein [Aliikangiella marina]TQV73667.1 DUF962 domain-containing protein [Aliikangiella marina]
MTRTHQFSSFNDFWPFYLGEHREKSCRVLHYVGTVGANALLIYFIWQQMWAWIPLALVFGYGPAWIGHFFIENNRPATFKHPWWSFIGDYKMLYLAATGKLKAELAKLD